MSVIKSFIRKFHQLVFIIPFVKVYVIFIIKITLMSKIKVAVFFTYDYTIGTLKTSGLFEREMKIYDVLAKKYDIEFIFFTYDEILNSKDFGYKNFQFYPIYKFAKRFENKIIRLFYSFFIPFKINKKLRGVHLIHQHQLLGSWVPLILKYLQNIPLLVRTGYDAYAFSIENDDRKIKIFFYKILTKVTLRCSEIYTVTSFSDLSFLKKYFPTENVKVVPNWIEKASNIHMKKKRDNILMVGRLESQKNYPLAFELIKSLNGEFELDIYGSGSKKEYLALLANNEGLKVNFLENISHSELLKTYGKYKYFLSTSKFEGNPKTILEAINNKCIVFATDISNHSEIISNGFNGYLYSNLNDLVEKFNNVKNKPNLQNSISINCEASLANNQIDKVIETMYRDYELLISSKYRAKT